MVSSGRLLLALLLGFFLAVQVSDAFALKKIRIPLYQRQYIQVKVGIPGRVLTLRLRWDLSNSFLYDSPYTYSSTFGSDGSDLFFLSSEIPPIRLPVVYGQEPSQLLSPYLPYYNGLRQDTSGGVSYNGVLGMAPGSYIWRYWSEFTISKYTICLGGYDDLDVLSGGTEIASAQGFTVNIGCLPATNSTWPLDFTVEEEFTYLPVAIFPEIQSMLFHSKDHRIEDLIYPTFGNGTRIGTSELVFWMSPSSSVIVSSFGAPEMALRIAEREGKNASRITLGRLHIIEDFVYHYNMLTRAEQVELVFDTFPATPDGFASDGFLSLLSLFMWCLWSLELVAMIYQWIFAGIYPRVRNLCAELRNRDISWISVVKKKRYTQLKARMAAKQKAIGQDISSRQEYTSGDADDASYEPQGEVHNAYDSKILNKGPVDWTMVACMLFLVRLLCFWTVYTAIWGFKSMRFAEHLAKVANLDATWGRTGYWATISFVLAVPMVVNLFFIRRYTQAGTVLIQMAIIGSLWINRLPETTSLFFSLIVNIIFGTILLFRALEWFFWCMYRGSDSALSMNIEAADEFPHEQDLAKTSVTTSGRLSDAAQELRSMAADAADRIQKEAMGSREPLLPTTARLRPSAGKRKKSNPDDDNSGPDQGSEASDRDLLQRSAARSYTRGDVILLVFWTFILLPGSFLWTYQLNIMPMVENLFPSHPMRHWIASFYLFGVVCVAAWCSVSRTYLQILQQGVIEIREAFIDLSTRLKVQYEILKDHMASC